MRCPRCLSGDYTIVMNTVHRQDGSVRRRHGCRYCQIRWTSSELIEPGSLISYPVPRPAVGDQPSTGPELSVFGPGVWDDDDLQLGREDVPGDELLLHK